MNRLKLPYWKPNHDQQIMPIESRLFREDSARRRSPGPWAPRHGLREPRRQAYLGPALVVQTAVPAKIGLATSANLHGLMKSSENGLSSSRISRRLESSMHASAKFRICRKHQKKARRLHIRQSSGQPRDAGDRGDTEACASCSRSYAGKCGARGWQICNNLV